MREALETAHRDLAGLAGRLALAFETKRLTKRELVEIAEKLLEVAGKLKGLMK